MKTLRLLRNIAALFILVVVLFGPPPGVGARHATRAKACVGAFKSGFNCFEDPNGGCTEVKCTSPTGCANNRCAKEKPF